MLIGLISLISRIIETYSWLIIVWALLSWVPISRSDSLVQDIREVLDRLVAPYMNLFRRVVPPVAGIDFSPMVALVVLELIRILLGS